jgi:hypothetical protein
MTMTECRKCHLPITQDGRDGHWTDDVRDPWADICIDGNLHEPDEAP